MDLEELRAKRKEISEKDKHQPETNGDLERLRERRRQIREKSDAVFENMQAIADESTRVSEVAHDSRTILDDLDRQFEKKTGLTRKQDIAFLFLATALQMLRIIIVNYKTEIEEAGKGRIEKQLKTEEKSLFQRLYKDKEYNQESAHKYYAPFHQIIASPQVPYDVTAAMNKDARIFKGGNHRFATLAHDPVIGLVVGTSNILTNTITCADQALLGYARKNSGREARTIPIGIPDIRSYHVVYNEKTVKKGIIHFNSPKIGDRCSNIAILDAVSDRAMTDRDSVVAALIKQIIHIGTDMFTPCGIQFPGANLVLSNDIVEKLTKYVSFGDMVKAGASAGIAELINLVIAALHGLTYDEGRDGSREILAVRTKKIINISNAIATTSNILWVGANVYGGDKTQIKNLDVGGLLVTIYNLTHSAAFIRKVKEEYIATSFNRMIQGEALNLKEISGEI